MMRRLERQIMGGIDYIVEANLILNSMALFIMFGMIVHTSLFRRRGKPEDKLFFSLILSGISAAVTEGWITFMQGTSADIHKLWFIMVTIVMYLSYVAFAIFWCGFVSLRTRFIQRKLPKAALYVRPFLAVILIVASAGSFIGAWHSIKASAWIIETRPYFILVYMTFLLAGIVTFVMIWDRLRRGVILMIALFLSGVLFDVFLNEVSFMPIMMSIVLIYAHLFTIRDSFYEGVSVK